MLRCRHLLQSENEMIRSCTPAPLLIRDGAAVLNASQQVKLLFGCVCKDQMRPEVA